MKQVVIGLDHGNGFVKMRSETTSLKLPSAFGYLEDMSDSWKGKKLNLKKYKIGNVEFVWGKDISEIRDTIDTYGQQNRYTQDHYKVLTQIALAEIVSQSQISPTDEITIVTGVPSDEIGKIAEEQLIATLKGMHVVYIDGTEISLNVTNVIVLPQPFGSVMKLYLDVNGFVLDESYEEKRVGIIDIGSGTTDLDIINQLKREPAYKSIPIAMNDVYTHILEFIGKKTIEPSILSIQKYFDSGIYTISKRIGDIDFSDEKDKAISKVANRIVTEVSKKWKNFDQFDEVIVTGGGAVLFAPYLESLMGNITIIENYQMANVEGFYRFGRMETEE